MSEASAGSAPDKPAVSQIAPADIYRTAVDEYRFQAQYNWSRTQYLLGLNAAVLTAATVVASRPGKAAVGIYLVGAVLAAMSVVVVKTQHEYYRAARNRMQRIESQFGIPLADRLDSTATLGKRKRSLSVNQVTYGLLAVIAATDIGGGLLIILSR